MLPHSAPHHTRLYFALNTLEHETGLQLQPRSTLLDLDQAGAICHCVYSPCIPWEGREGRAESEWAQDKAHSCGKQHFSTEWAISVATLFFFFNLLAMPHGRGILVPWPGIEPAPPRLEGRV